MVQIITNNLIFFLVWSWKLSRTRTLTDNAVTSMNAVIDTVPVLENRLFERIDQGADACFYLPDIGLDKPAIFPGQCDETIPTQQNFDPERVSYFYTLIKYCLIIELNRHNRN